MHLDINTIAGEAIARLPVEDFAHACADRIIKAGGKYTANSEGRSIYPSRADVWIDHVQFDPHLRRSVQSRVRVRVTVELERVAPEVPA